MNLKYNFEDLHYRKFKTGRKKRVIACYVKRLRRGVRYVKVCVLRRQTTVKTK